MNIAVLGLGRVGAVAAAGLAEAGHRVLGVDIDNARLESLRRGQADFYEPGLDQLLRLVVDSGSLSFALPSQVQLLQADAAVIAVGTPPLPSGGTDLSSVKAALSWLTEHSAQPPLVVMKSTLPPGTGVNLARQFCLRYVSNPEFLREGQALHDWRHPDRIVIGGASQSDVEMAKRLYPNPEACFVVTDVSTAEMIKYAANAFLSTKISFINEIANLCDHLGADITDVVGGLGLDPRIGPSFLRAGIGYGGSCFPKDVRALEYLSTLNGYSPDLLKAVISVNNRQRLLPVQILRRELGSLAGREVAILGLSFKPGTDDIREAPAVDLVRVLVAEGVRVKAYDPMVKPKAGILPTEVVHAPTALEALAGVEALVLCTEWDEFACLDWKRVYETMHAPYLIVDGRNMLDPETLKSFGFRYAGIGRGRRTTGEGQGGGANE